MTISSTMTCSVSKESHAILEALANASEDNARALVEFGSELYYSGVGWGLGFGTVLGGVLAFGGWHVYKAVKQKKEAKDANRIKEHNHEGEGS